MAAVRCHSSTNEDLIADEVKQALRGRHPGNNFNGMVGRWTCIEEWRGIDLLALDAWRASSVIGYEVKVSRSDMRTELLRPHKRADAVAMTTEFYFAVPAGLLKPEEIAWQEPEWNEGDFDRKPCPGVPTRQLSRRGWYGRVGGECRKVRNGRQRSFMPKSVPTGYLVRMPVPVVIRPLSRSYVDNVPLPPSLHDVDRAVEDHGYELVRCPRCNGTGYEEKSRVELEAPCLWVPRDVGLIVIDGRGCTVVKSSPKRKDPKPIASSRQQINDLVRWVSHRPDPRHR